MGIEKSSDEGENPSEYKRRHRRELDNLFRANGIIASQVAGSKEYDRGYTWNFEWCSEDPDKAQPKKVALVQKYMSEGSSFDVAFDAVANLFPEPEWGAPSLDEALRDEP